MAGNPYVVDMSPMHNMLARWGQERQQQRQMEQQADQFQQTNMLARDQMGQQESQFGQSLGLQRDQLSQSGKQFGMSYGLDKGRLDLQRGEADERRAKEFEHRAAGIAQMVMDDQDPASRSAKWGRLVSSDPRWRAALAKSGVDHADPVAGAQFIIAQARGYREPEGYKLTELDPNKTLIGTNPKTGASKIIHGPVDGAHGPYKDMKQKADVEAGLRKEVEKYAGDYTTLRNAVANIENLAANPSAATDIGTVFSFMKILDPGSVVRETEYAIAAKAAGVPERIVGIITKVQNGEFLTPAQRQDFIATARTLAAGQRRFYESKISQYRDVAERSRVEPNNVVLPEPSQVGTPAAGSGPRPGIIQDGWRFNGGNPADPKSWAKVQP